MVVTEPPAGTCAAYFADRGPEASPTNARSAPATASALPMRKTRFSISELLGLCAIDGAERRHAVRGRRPGPTAAPRTTGCRCAAARASRAGAGLSRVSHGRPNRWRAPPESGPNCEFMSLLPPEIELDVAYQAASGPLPAECWKPTGLPVKMGERPEAGR